jgi:hypothetical protein
MAFILFYMVYYIASALLLRDTEGAVWQAVICSLVSPLGTLWWALFKEKPEFHWEPAWELSTTYALLGLVVMTPGVLLYQMSSSSPDGSRMLSLSRSLSYHGGSRSGSSAGSAFKAWPTTISWPEPDKPEAAAASIQDE